MQRALGRSTEPFQMGLPKPRTLSSLKGLLKRPLRLPS
jgi:hypothetical protein